MKHELDATNQSLGRLASRVAILLRGKEQASFQPHIMPTTEVVLKNISKIKFTGTKYENKIYYKYSGYPGGMRERTLEDMWKKSPQEVVRHTVYGMLPKNRMRDKIIRHLKFQ